MTNPAINESASAQQRVVMIEGALTAATAETWRTRILDTSFALGGISVDVSRLTDCDTLGLQVLASAARSAAMAAVPFSIAGTTETFARTCAALGLSLDPRPTQGGRTP